MPDVKIKKIEKTKFLPQLEAPEEFVKITEELLQF